MVLLLFLPPLMILLDNVHATIDDQRERQRIGQLLRFRKKGYQFSEAYKRRGWDGWVKLVSAYGQFPAGLLPLVQSHFPDIQVEDKRVRPQPCDALRPVTLKAQLMDHQQRAVESAYEQGRGVIEHAVAAGKSMVTVAMVARCAVPTLILVHTKELLYQMIDDNLLKFLEIPGLIGIIGDGRWEPNWVTVSTYQSIRAAFKSYPEEARAFMDSRQAVMVDEVQHIQAKTYEEVMKQARNAYYRFGCSATPFKSHGMGEQDIETYYKVTGWTGPVVSRFDSEEGIDVGRLVPADVYVVDYGASNNGLPWPAAYESGIVLSRERNAAIAQLAALAPKPALILIERIEHGDHLQQLLGFPGLNLETEFIHGSDKSSTRKDAIADLRRESYDVLIASVILDEGVDIPNVRTLILAGGGKAQHRILQRIGRGMRAADRKRNLVVFDFADAGRYLGAHARKRQLLYEREPAYTVYRLTLNDAVEALT